MRTAQLKLTPDMSPTPLEIKTKAVQRLLKEEQLYLKDISEQEEQLQQMRASDTDEYEIKKYEKVLDESKRMVPELKKKIQEHAKGLKSYIEDYKGDEDTSDLKALLQKCGI